jgi:hypothetical protein
MTGFDLIDESDCDFLSTNCGRGMNGATPHYPPEETIAGQMIWCAKLL